MASGGVLLVEDDELLANLVLRLLGHLNRPIFCAATAAAALELIKQHRSSISLGVIDCQLPDMHGGELCVALRSQAPGLALLLTSGRDQRAILESLAASGPTVFLAKPYLPGEVVRRVTALLTTSA